jgi:AcrR family transcriptional regulator
VAARAGVSPGTVYSYFATKEEIFSTLYAEAIHAYNERLRPLCEEATDLEAFLVEILRSYLELWGTYGRHFSLWAELAPREDQPDGRLPEPLTAELAAAARVNGKMVAAALRRLIPGPSRPRLSRRRVAFVAAAMVGVADHLLTDRHLVSGVKPDELIAFAARGLAAGLRSADDPGSEPEAEPDDEPDEG